MKATLAGAGIAGARLRSLPSVVAVLVALLAVAVVALLERRFASSYAADRALTGVSLGIVLPLWSYGLVARTAGGRALTDALQEAARFGASRRTTLLGWLALNGALGAVIGALLAAVAVIVTRAPADPRLGSNLFTSLWIGLLSGLSYVCWFAAASTFGARGGGRLWALGLDWILGAGVSVIALPWPRTHIRNLLGTEPVLGLPQWASSIALLVLAGACALLAVLRSPR